jgi:hypothetical protein
LPDIVGDVHSIGLASPGWWISEPPAAILSSSDRHPEGHPDWRLEMLNTYSTTDLVSLRQRELRAAARDERLAAEAHGQEAQAAEERWQSRLAGVRHAFAAFAVLPSWSGIRVARAASRP